MATKRRKAPEHFNDPIMPWSEAPEPVIPRAELRALMRGALPKAGAAKIDEFLTICGRAASLASFNCGLDPAAGRVQRLRAVEAGCHKLVTALRDLRRGDLSALGEAVDALANGIAKADLSEQMRGDVERIARRDGPHQIGPGCPILAERLNALFDAAQDVEAIAANTADSEKSRVARNERPKLHAARILVDVLVRAHRDVFCDLPPTGRNGWFHRLVARLGESCELSCGSDLVNDVIGAYRRR